MHGAHCSRWTHSLAAQASPDTTLSGICWRRARCVHSPPPMPLAALTLAAGLCGVFVSVTASGSLCVVISGQLWALDRHPDWLVETGLPIGSPSASLAGPSWGLARCCLSACSWIGVACPVLARKRPQTTAAPLRTHGRAGRGCRAPLCTALTSASSKPFAERVLFDF